MKINLKHCLSTLVLGALVAFPLNAQQVYSIYDEATLQNNPADYEEISFPNQAGRPLIFNVTKPTVTVYKPEKSVDTGAAVIIAPGGGNMYLTWEEEGVNVAQWFARQGITGIVLKYRTKYMGKTPDEVQKNLTAFLGKLASDFNEMGKQAADLQGEKTVITAPVQRVEKTIQGDDGRQAVKYVRQHAKEWSIDPQRIALMGFSAGGMLTTNVLFIHDAESKPNLVAPIYGVFSDPGMPTDAMPVFLCAPVYDLGGPEASELLFNRLRAAKVPAELHFIYEAVHGEGLLYNGKQWNQWIELLHGFMKSTGFLTSKQK